MGKEKIPDTRRQRSFSTIVPMVIAEKIKAGALDNLKSESKFIAEILISHFKHETSRVRKEQIL